MRMVKRAYIRHFGVSPNRETSAAEILLGF